MNTKPTGVLVQASGLRTRGFRCTHGTETHNRGTYSTEMHTESNLPCSSTGSRSPLRHEIRSSHLFGEKLHPRLVKLQKRLIRVTSNCFNSYLIVSEFRGKSHALFSTQVKGHIQISDTCSTVVNKYTKATDVFNLTANNQT